MLAGLRKSFTLLLLLGIFLSVGAQPVTSHYFPSQSSLLLEGILNHVIHSPLPPPTVDPRYNSNTPCLFYGKEMLSNYIYILKEKNFAISEVSDQQVEGKVGFMKNLDQLKQKIYLLESQVETSQAQGLPTLLSAIQAAGESAHYKSFVDAFLPKQSRKLSPENEALVKEIYELVKPFKSRARTKQAGALSAFAPIVLASSTDENEFCKQTEQATLVFQSMDYPKINWELRLQYTLHCSCSFNTDQELSYMSSQIQTPIASSFRTSSPSNLVFIQTGDPELHILEAACCMQGTASPTPDWPTRSDSLESTTDMGALLPSTHQHMRKQ